MPRGPIYRDTLTLWTPTQSVQGDLSVTDALYTQIGTAAVSGWLEPISPRDRLMIFGDMDVRSHHLWLPAQFAQGASALPPKTYVFDTVRLECWLLVSVMDAYDAIPRAAHAEGVVRFQQVFPDYIKEGLI